MHPGIHREARTWTDMRGSELTVIGALLRPAAHALPVVDVAVHDVVQAVDDAPVILLRQFPRTTALGGGGQCELCLQATG